MMSHKCRFNPANGYFFFNSEPFSIIRMMVEDKKRQTLENSVLTRQS